MVRRQERKMVRRQERKNGRWKERKMERTEDGKNGRWCILLYATKLHLYFCSFRSFKSNKVASGGWMNKCNKGAKGIKWEREGWIKNKHVFSGSVYFRVRFFPGAIWYIRARVLYKGFKGCIATNERMIPCNALTLRHLGSLSILYVGMGRPLIRFVFGADGHRWGSKHPPYFCAIRSVSY